MERLPRGATSHVDDGAKAAEIFAQIPDFLADARHLLDVVDLATCSPAFRREVESHAVPFLTLAAAAPADR